MNYHIHAKSFVHKPKALYSSLKIPLLFYARVMKLVAFFLFILSMSAAADVAAQKIDLQVENATMKSVLMELTKKTGYTFLFKENEIAKADPVSINLKQKDISEILLQLFSDQPFTYDIKGKIVSIKPKIPVKEISLPQSTIRGRITDSVGNGLEGVVVELEGTSLRTVTDKQGYYVLDDILIGGNIVFRLIGYETVRMVANRPEINTALHQVINKLSEVVVSKGYYTTTKELNTGSVSTVKADVLERQPVGDPLLALSGRVPGLNIQQTSGLPGSAPNFSIRGRNSLANGNDPLFVIDGVPYLATYPAGGAVPSSAAGPFSPFANIPIQSIESVEVLKDADATAIYGSRGANGVILITTKQANYEKTSLNIDINQGAGNISRKIDLLNTKQYLSIRKKAFEYDVLDYGAIDYDVNGIWDQERHTDWQEVMIGGTAHLTNANLAIQGGNMKTHFSISGTYRRETTVFPGDSKSKQLGAYISLNHESKSKRFKISYNGLISNLNVVLPHSDFTTNIMLAPNSPALYDKGGALNWENSTWFNPLWPLNQTASTMTNNLNNDLNLSYQILKGLFISGRFGANNSSRNGTRLSPFKDYDPAFTISPANRRHQFGNFESKSWNIEPMISYDKRFERSVLNFLIGSTFQETRSDQLSILGTGFSSDEQVKNLGAATTVLLSNVSDTQYRYSALYSRLGYNYLERYIVNLTGRRDGSSRFGPGKQFGNFWAIGASWIFSKESFFPKNHILSLGKIRGSYGITGNDQLGEYKYISAYTVSGNSYQGIRGLSPIQHTNPNYGWETVNKFEGAIELGLWKNQIQLTLNYYRNRTSNQLVGYALPVFTGFPSVQANLPAIIQNTGTEIELNANLFNNQKFSWTIDFNFSVPRNKLISYPNLETSSYRTQYAIGRSLSGAFLYHYTGLEAESQFPTFEDLNSDGRIRSADDRRHTFLGQRSFAGLNNSFSINNNIRLDIFLQYVNQNGYQFIGSDTPGSNTGYSNMSTSVLNNSSIYKRFTSSSATPLGSAYRLLNQSDGVLGDASFLRVKNVSLSWDASTLFNSIVNSSILKLYMQTQNLFTFTKYKGLDPEVGLSSAIGAAPRLPALRMMTFGIQLTL